VNGERKHERPGEPFEFEAVRVQRCDVCSTSYHARLSCNKEAPGATVSINGVWTQTAIQEQSCPAIAQSVPEMGGASQPRDSCALAFLKNRFKQFKQMDRARPVRRDKRRTFLQFVKKRETCGNAGPRYRTSIL